MFDWQIQLFGFVAHQAQLPEQLTTRLPPAVTGTRVNERLDEMAWQARPATEIGQISEPARGTRRDDPLDTLISQPTDTPQPKPDGSIDQGTASVTQLDVEGCNCDPMPAGVTHQNGWWPKTHGLMVEQR